MSKTNVAELNEKLQQLLKLTEEINTLAPDGTEFDLPHTWEDIFENTRILRDSVLAISNNGVIPAFHNVELVFKATGSLDEFDTAYNNFLEEYPEFINNYTKEDWISNFATDERTCHLRGIWVGDVEDCIKLTHHAEAFYEETNLEYVHVEVCVDGKWYGKEKERDLDEPDRN